MLDKNIYNLVNYAKKTLPNARIEMISNGDVLNEERLKKLYDSGLDRLQISLYDGEEQHYNFVKLGKKLNLSNKISLYKSDIDNFNYGKYDLIISNPPYIKSIDFKYLEKDVSKFEPKLALDGGLDGLSEIRKVINKSSELIKNNGKLILEVAFDQKSKVKNLLKEKGFYINRVLKDLSNNDRCIISTKI